MNGKSLAWKITAGIIVVVIVPLMAWALLGIVSFPMVYAEKKQVAALEAKTDRRFEALFKKVGDNHTAQMQSITDVYKYMVERDR